MKGECLQLSYYIQDSDAGSQYRVLSETSAEADSFGESLWEGGLLDQDPIEPVGGLEGSVVLEPGNAGEIGAEADIVGLAQVLNEIDGGGFPLGNREEKTKTIGGLPEIRSELEHGDHDRVALDYAAFAADSDEVCARVTGLDVEEADNWGRDTGQDLAILEPLIGESTAGRLHHQAVR